MNMTLPQAVKYLRKIEIQFKDSPNKVLPKIAKEGTNVAKGLAPKSGLGGSKQNIHTSILNYPKNKETWIITSMQPLPKKVRVGNKIYTSGLYQGQPFPYHLFIETGQLNKMSIFGRKPFRLKTGTTGYMLKTKEILEKELIKQMNIEIKRIIK